MDLTSAVKQWQTLLGGWNVCVCATRISAIRRRCSFTEQHIWLAQKGLPLLHRRG